MKKRKKSLHGWIDKGWQLKWIECEPKEHLHYSDIIQREHPKKNQLPKIFVCITIEEL